jgi:hypothetical protein
MGSNLRKSLERSCAEVGLRLDLGFTVTCPDGHEIRSLARIRDIGDVNGMLIFTDFDEVSDHLKCLSASGYGYSVLSEPGDDEEFDLESVKEMLRDWGWVDRERRAPIAAQ